MRRRRRRGGRKKEGRGDKEGWKEIKKGGRRRRRMGDKAGREIRKEEMKRTTINNKTRRARLQQRLAA